MEWVSRESFTPERSYRIAPLDRRSRAAAVRSGRRAAARGETINTNPGQTVRLREARVWDSVAGLPPGHLEQLARNIAQDQPVFLGVDAQNTNILGQPQEAGAPRGQYEPGPHP